MPFTDIIKSANIYNVSVCVCLCVYASMYMCVYMRICMRVFMCMCMCIWCMCVCVCMRMCICIFVIYLSEYNYFLIGIILRKYFIWRWSNIIRFVLLSPHHFDWLNQIRVQPNTLKLFDISVPTSSSPWPLLILRVESISTSICIDTTQNEAVS